MHFLALIVAEDPVAALEPFRLHDEAPPYLRPCPFGTHPGCRGCGGTGLWETTLNPLGTWDYFGATHGNLPLRPGARPLRRRDDYAGLCWEPSFVGDGPGHYPQVLASIDADWDQARKRDVDVDALVYAGCYAMVLGEPSVWHQGDDDASLVPSDRVSLVPAAGWLERFGELVRAVPDDALLTVVDCHV